MARITIADYDAYAYPNHMRWVDNEQFDRYQKSGGLAPYKVCVVDVCAFRFVFHSVMQVELCLEYYSRKIHSTSRLPVYTQNLGGDHWEMQRWFERLPMFLLEGPKRLKVVSALKRAIAVYRAVPGAITSTPRPAIWSHENA